MKRILFFIITNILVLGFISCDFEELIENAQLIKKTKSRKLDIPSESIFNDTPIESALYIPKGTTSIYRGQSGMKGVTAVNIPGSVEEISPMAFKNNGLVSIVIENPNIQILDRAFDNNPIEEVILRKELFDRLVQQNRLGAIFGNRDIIYRVANTVSEIRNILVVAQGTTKITKSQYKGKNLDEVILPDSLVTIEASAFRKNRLRSIIFPTSKELIIHEMAFIENELTSLELPENIEYVGRCAFFANRLTSVTIFNSKAEYYWSELFRGNEKLKTVILPSTFYPDRWSLWFLSRIFGEQVVSYKDHEGTRYYEDHPDVGVYMESDSDHDNPMEEVTLSKELFDTHMQENRLRISNRDIIYRVASAVSEVRNILVIADGTTKITKSQYKGKNLDEVILPDSLVTIGEQAFMNNRLKSVVFPDSIRYIRDEAFKNNKLTSLDLPKNLKYVATESFMNNLLTAVTFPSSVTYINLKAFQNNKLTSLIVPETIQMIRYRAFFANKLTSVTISNPKPSYNTEAFFGNKELRVVVLSPSHFTRDFGGIRSLQSIFGKQVNVYKDHKGNILFDRYPIPKLAVKQKIKESGGVDVASSVPKTQEVEINVPSSSFEKNEYAENKGGIDF